jgi:hypothetical protein
MAMPQQRTILFLGAGASRALGYPLTAEILPEILRRLKARTLFPMTDDVVQGLPDEHAAVNSFGFHPDPMAVFQADLSALFPTLIDASNPPNITDILSLFDHLIFSGSAAVPGFSRERLARLRLLIERAIATVVTEPATRSPEQKLLVDRLVAWLLQEAASADGQRITIVTTNYDLAVERPVVAALNGSTNSIDYGFSWRDPYQQVNAEDVVHVRPEKPAVSLFKLHGSINWVRCPQCDHVYVNQVEGPIFQLSYASRAQESTTCSCGYFPFGTLLVAPSMIRDIRDPSLLSIWQAALEAMRLAERWVIVGYSLPAEDLAIRSMFLRASRGRRTPPRVDIFDVGAHPEIEQRYQLILKNVSYDGGGFEKFIKEVTPVVPM